MIIYVADFFTGLVEAMMMFMLYNTFCVKKDYIPNWVYNVGMIVLAIMINISNSLFGYDLLNFAVMILSCIAVSFLYDTNIAARVLLPVFNLSLFSILEIIVLGAMMIFGGLSANEAINIPSYRLLGIIVSKMLSLFVVNIIRLKYKKKQVLFRASYWVLFLLMLVTNIIAIFLIFELSLNTNDSYLQNLFVIGSFGLLFSTFFALYLYEHLSEQAEKIYNQQQYEQHLKSQIKHLDEILVTQNELKKFKHDFSHCIIGLKGYIENKDYEKASEYLSTLTEKFISGRNIIETGNTALDAVLSTKKAIAESKGISFNTKIQIPENLPIEPIDLCVIFGNAADNAIEACDRTQNCDKKINLTIICQDNRLFCKIENTAPPIKDKSLKTEKADKRNHGFGLENIRTALAKYEAEPSIEYSDSRFVLKFVIFLNE